MRTVRSTISSACTKWFDQGDPLEGKCIAIKLVHIHERSPEPQKIEAWPTPPGHNIQATIAAIEEEARNHAANCKGGIVEEYGLIPYFRNGAVGGLRVFSIRSAGNDDADGDGSGMGAYTEGPNGAGIRHQDMRHLEAKARIYVDGISQNQQVSMQLMSVVMTRNERLETQLDTMRNEVEDAKDRRLERELAAYSAHEKVQRDNKIIDGLIPVGMTLANAAMGMPLFPVSSDDTAINMYKSWIRSFTLEQMDQAQKMMNTEQYMLFATAKSQILDEDERRTNEAKLEAQKNVTRVVNSEEMKQTAAKRDEAGIPRSSLSPSPGE